MLSFIKNVFQLNASLAKKIQADRLYDEAIALMIAKEFKNAFPLMQQSSEFGNKQAPSQVAMMLLKGQGTSANWASAVEYLELAVANGTQNVHIILGTMYGMGGYGLKRDAKLAERHLEQSIAVDSDPAGETMLAMLRKREGVFGGKEIPRPRIPWG